MHIEPKHIPKNIKKNVLNKKFATYHIWTETKNLKFTDWFTKRNSKTWIDVDIDCMNLPTDNPNQKTLCVSESIAVGYSLAKFML